MTLTCGECGTTAPPGTLFCECGEALDAQATLHPSGAGQLVRQGPLPAGALLADGRYTVGRHLAQGGMGAIYLAHDAHKHTQCVVKEMLPKADAAERFEAEQAFRQEAEILAELHHENIVTVWDAFEEQGCHYLVEEFIGGGDLNALVNAPEMLSETRTLDIAVQIATAFQYIHTYHQAAPPGSQVKAPIIYRDMKPANVMLRADGQVLVADFGIVRLFKPGRSRDTINLGTHGYAAPEMISNTQSDERSDLYTLGSTLHELLTKKDPANNVNFFQPVRTFRPDISEAFEQIIMRLLEDRPERRYQTAAELLNDLRGLQERWRATRCSHCAHQNPLGASACQQCHLPLRPVTGQEALLHGGETRLGAFSGVTASTMPWTPVWQFALGRGTRASPCLHEGQLYIATEAGTLDIFDVRSGRGVQRLQLRHPSRSTPLVTPFGVLVGHKAGASLVDPRQATVKDFPGLTAEVFAAPVRIGPDQVCIGSYDGHVTCVALRTMETRWNVSVGDAVLGSLAADGRDLAVTTKDGQVSILDARSGGVRWMYRAGHPIFGHALLADDAVVILDHTGRLTFLDRQRGTVLLQTGSTGQTYTSPALAGSTLVTVDMRGTVRALSAAGKSIWECALREDVLASPVILGECAVIATRSGRLHFLSVLDGRSVQSPVECPYNFISSPIADGNTLVAIDQAGNAVALVNS